MNSRQGRGRFERVRSTGYLRACTAPLVSIISATYDQARYVAQCVEIALAQTYADWEQIVVDDGSADTTRESDRPLR